MMSEDSLTFLRLDLLLIEIEVSNSALMVYRLVLFLLFLFCQISSRPDDSREIYARRKGSSEVSSTLSDLSYVIFLS